MSGIDEARAPARIASVEWDDERGPCVWVHLKGRDDTWGQAFGGHHLGDQEHRRMYVADLCATFGVADPELLEGKLCYVLRSYASWGELAVGLESEETGRRFVANAWCREHFPSSNVMSLLEQRRASLALSIASYRRRLRETQDELDRVAAGFVDWESMCDTREEGAA